MGVAGEIRQCCQLPVKKRFACQLCHAGMCVRAHARRRSRASDHMNEVTPPRLAPARALCRPPHAFVFVSWSFSPRVGTTMVTLLTLHYTTPNHTTLK